jgi:O-antigen/teichoic acid export membrane protein
MTSSSVGLARGILRNAGALLLVGLFAKGMGLVIAVLIARFLGADAMGLFALLFSVAILLETFISIGMSDSLVRDAAARPRQARDLYRQALKLVLWISLIPTILLAGWAVVKSGDAATRNSLLVVALGAPVSGAFVVSQAVLQGMERVLFLTWVTFVARLTSLVWLAIVLYRGAGVEAAFASRALFQAMSVAAFYVALRRRPSDEASLFNMRDLFTRSLPFAINLGVRDLGARLPSLVLPATIGLGPSGIFDTANRVRSTLGMTMSAAIVGMMPSFARNLSEPAAGSERLVGYSVKYMCIGMSAVATIIALCSDWIVRLLFGSAFTGAAQPMQILAWAQVLVAMDAVMQQVMLAAGREYAAVSYSAIGVLAQLALILALASATDLRGVAAALLLSSAVSLALDLRFVARNVAPIAVRTCAGGPLAAAGLVAASVWVLQEQPFVYRVLAAIVAWAAAIAVFRLFPRDELRFLKQVVPLRRWPRGSA